MERISGEIAAGGEKLVVYGVYVLEAGAGVLMVVGLMGVLEVEGGVLEIHGLFWGGVSWLALDRGWVGLLLGNVGAHVGG